MRPPPVKLLDSCSDFETGMDKAHEQGLIERTIVHAKLNLSMQLFCISLPDTILAHCPPISVTYARTGA